MEQIQRTEQFGGFFFTQPQGGVLPEELRRGILEKWEMANEEGEIDDLIAECEGIAKPKAFLKVGKVENVTESGCTVGGSPFTGPLVAEKLGASSVVAGYVITCGRELHDYAEQLTKEDILLGQAAMDVCLAYLRVIGSEVHKYAKEVVFDGGNMAALNPGSLNSWPIEGQKELFAYLGDGADATGILLTDSMLMIPYKSGSGVYFPTEKHYENCMRCPRVDCPNRRAAYVEE